MRYPSVWLRHFADWLEVYEPHEKIEALADKVEDLEQPFETRLDWLYERLTAYRRLQEVRREADQAKKDRLVLTRAYGELIGSYERKTGETPPPMAKDASAAGARAVREITPQIRRVAALIDDLRYRTRG